MKKILFIPALMALMSCGSADEHNAFIRTV